MSRKFTDDAKRRLLREFSLPVPVVKEPYFMHFMELLEPMYGSLEALSLLEDAVTQCGGEKKFYSYRDNVVSRMLKEMTETDSWQSFLEDDLTKTLSVEKGWKADSLYLRENAGKNYVSLDLKHANYQSLKWLDKNLVLNTKSFEELLGQYTDLEYLTKSKLFRQYFFGLGPMLPKRQRRAQQALMTSLYRRLESLGLDKSMVASANNDELVFLGSDKMERLVLNAKEQMLQEGVLLHVESFELKHVHPEKSFYAKKMSNGGFKLKNVDKQFVPEVVRHLNGEDPNEKDRYFMHEGRLSQYLETLY